MNNKLRILMRIPIYFRVSTTQQRQDCTSLDTWAEEIRRLLEFQEDHGAEVDEMSEQGSGADEDRPDTLLTQS